MMKANTPVFLQGQSAPLQLGPILGSGGEGTVYKCATDSGRLVKIYHDPTAFHGAKLRAMLNMRALVAYPRLAWPQELVIDASGCVCGYAMRRLSGVSLVPITAPVLRKKKLPHWSAAHSVRVTHDLAALFGLLEANGVYIPDLNLANFAVTDDGVVSAFDCDAYSVATANHRYPSAVFSADLQAPEVLSGAVSLGSFGPAQFRGAAAILFFGLLTDGGQAYATREGLSVQDAIVSGRYIVGGREARGQTSSAVFSAYMRLGPRICWLFKRAFIAGHNDPNARPTFSEWQQAMAAFYRDLQTRN
jgi:DNA-binding helix-hairpin-helix protein with protein kinase domain